MYKEFTPKSFLCLKEGYSLKIFKDDLFAGLTVGVIALPLALAFAIGSGVAPEKGLFTAVIAGFLISLLGGSRVQIGGPTGAFVVIVYAVIEKHGYEGLAVATVIAGLLMILMGLARLGFFLRYIPYPVVTGFTTGIAVVIFKAQMDEFIASFALSLTTLAFIFFLRRYYPKLPGTIIAVILATACASIFNLPVETIALKFGQIPRLLPTPSLPHFSLDIIQQVFPDAIAIALLGAIESLLSATVADGMTGYKHRSNCELVGQGIANIGSILFGGIPATGAIARTTANVKTGGKTPIAGMIHAITLLLLMLLFAPYAGMIPLGALSAVLIFVAWNMSEMVHFIEILKGPRGDAVILLISFFLTVVIDLTVAVQVGVILGAVIFLKRMTDKTTLEEDEKEGISIFDINGPFFYSVSSLLDIALVAKAYILRLRKTPLIDASGYNAIRKFANKCQQNGIQFIITEPSKEQEKMLNHFTIFQTLEEALNYLETYVSTKPIFLSTHGDESYRGSDAGARGP